LKTITLIVLLVAIVLNAAANILVKASALKKDDEGLTGAITGILLNPWLIGGLASFGLAFVAYRFVLKDMKLSIAYPIMTTCGFAIVLVASRIFFQETLNSWQWIGIGFLVIGLWLIASQMSAA
jgi:multidrug transporter EmrE-like cation transporter